MKSFSKIVVIGFAVLVSACSSSSTEKTVAEDNGITITKTVVKDAPESKCTAKIAVDGMSCSVMCAGAIKGTLKKMDGVQVADVYFDPERKKSDFATIEFDNKKVTEKEMIAAIEKLNDGQYKVKSVEIVISEVSYQKIDEKLEKKDEKSPAPKVTAFNTISIVMPSIFAILDKVIR